MLPHWDSDLELEIKFRVTFLVVRVFSALSILKQVKHHVNKQILVHIADENM